MKRSRQLPLVSVVIPSYNRSDLLSHAIGSVIDQGYEHWELIVVDDGSTENIRTVLESFDDERLRYYRQLNQGVSVARNAGLMKATGEYVAFLDSDDMMDQGYLERKVDFALEHTQTGVIGGGCRYVDLDGKPILNETSARLDVTKDDLAVWTAFPGGASNIFSPRKLLLELGGFRAQLVNSEDRDLLRRIAEKHAVSSVDHVTAVIRVHSSERINRDLSSLIYCRTWVTRHIADPALRRLSKAWDQHVFGLNKWAAGKRIEAVLYWLHSFIVWPKRVRPNLSRIRQIFNAIVG